MRNKTKEESGNLLVKLLEPIELSKVLKIVGSKKTKFKN